MHNNNKTWLDDLKSKYPESFNGAKVLELGSGNMGLETEGQEYKLRGRNYGSIRGWFDNCEHIGVDIVPGLGVEFAVAAKDFKWREENYFDVLASFSLFEHDVEWKESIANGLKYLKPGGMIFMCWGAEGNLPHMDVWAIVPHKDILDFLESKGVEIIDSFFEEDRYGKDCAGCFNLVAKKNE